MTRVRNRRDPGRRKILQAGVRSIARAQGTGRGLEKARRGWRLGVSSGGTLIIESFQMYR